MYFLACGIRNVKKFNLVKIEKGKCNYNVKNSKHMYVNIFCDNTSCHHMMWLLDDKLFVFVLLKSISLHFLFIRLILSLTIYCKQHYVKKSSFINHVFYNSKYKIK